MKTNMKLKTITAVLFTLAILGGSIQTQAQRRSSNGTTVDREKRETRTTRESNEHRKVDEHRQEKPEYQVKHTDNNDRIARSRENEEIRERKSKSNFSESYDFRRDDRDRRKYNKPDYHSSKPDYRHNNKPDYHHPSHDWDRDRGNHHSYYVHPQYGRVYRKFDRNPYIFRYPQGRYYYYDGHFCEYRTGLGYVIIDAPLFTVFSELPFACKRIRIDGRVYYRYNGLYFEAHPHGYRLVPSPQRGVHLSINF